MKGKDFGIILVLALFVADGRWLLGVEGQRTEFGKGNFFQDKFCDVFCPKDDSQPRVTLTDEQIQTILDNDEILQMLEHNPDLLYNNENLDTACLIQLNGDQRDAILSQYGGFFSTPDDAELLAITANNVRVAEDVHLDPKDQAMLDNFLDDSARSPGYEESPTTVQANNNYQTSNDGVSSSDSGIYDSSNSGGSDSSGSDSGRYYYYPRYYTWGDGDSSSGSDSRRRKKRRTIRDTIMESVKREKQIRSPEEAQKLINDFIRKNSKKKRSVRGKSRSNRAVRVKRFEEGDYVRLCKADTNVEAISLAWAITTQQLVQIPQFTESGLNQWFVTEKCTQNYSDVNPDISCSRTSRTEKAIVMNFNGDIQETNIEIESCTAFVLASGGEVASVIASTEGAASAADPTNAPTPPPDTPPPNPAPDTSPPNPPPE